MKKVLGIILIGMMALILTGCGKTSEEKFKDYLKTLGYTCNNEEFIRCQNINNGITKTISQDGNNIIFGVETNDFTLGISKRAYFDEAYKIQALINNDSYSFIPKDCNDNCLLKVGDEVYPKEYANYLKYLESDNYKEYLRLKNSKNLSLSEKYRLLSLEFTHDLQIKPKEANEYTKDVNKYLREFESYFSGSGLKLK